MVRHLYTGLDKRTSFPATQLIIAIKSFMIQTLELILITNFYRDTMAQIN